jgi:hypothetical protein
MIRLLFALTGSLCFLMVAGCKPGVSPESPGTPQSGPKPAMENAGPIGEPVGTWSSRDENGQPFDLVLFENGQAVSTWVKGPMGAKGERGFWRKTPQGVLVLFEDGWTDQLILTKDGIMHQGFAPGASLSEAPANAAPAEKSSADISVFTGVWRLNREPDGTYLYITLQANGAAFSTINGLTEGRWELTAGTAKATWPDGWVDVIERVDGSWQKRSWVGGETATPADLTQATRVGELRFNLSP